MGVEHQPEDVMSALVSGFTLEIGLVNAAAASLRDEKLREIGGIFARNVSELLGLISLPIVSLVIGMQKGRHFELISQAVKQIAEAGLVSYDPDNPEAFLNAVYEVVRELERTSRWDSAKQLFPVLLDMPTMPAAIRALAYAVCASVWSYFECAAKDTWVAVVNARPFQLGQPALNRLPREVAADGLSGRHISVDLLARHGFDLRTCLGTLMSSKFDFTGVAGIRTAYHAAFGITNELKEALSNSELSHLEATRHLIVHRAGVVDEEYVRRTQEPITVGTQLALTGVRLGELTNGAVHAGSKLLQFADDWLAKHTAT